MMGKNLKAIAGALLASLLVLQMGCSGAGPENSGQKETVSPPEKVESPAKNNEDSQADIKNRFDSLLAKNAGASEVLAFIDKNVPLAAREGASDMLVSLEEIQKKNLPQLEEKYYKENGIQEKLGKVYSKNFDLKQLEEITDQEVKDLLTETREGGYKVETAEGMFFPVIDYEVYKKYGTNAAADIKGYFDLMAVESNAVPAKDAALVIGWDEVIKRALAQEKFIASYKDSRKAEEVRQLLKKYLVFTLFGSNNTPLFDYDTKTMVPAAKTAYLETLKNNKEGEFIKILSDYMELLNKNNYKLTDAVDKFRKTATETVKF